VTERNVVRRNLVFEICERLFVVAGDFPEQKEPSRRQDNDDDSSQEEGTDYLGLRALSDFRGLPLCTCISVRYTAIVFARLTVINRVSGVMLLWATVLRLRVRVRFRVSHHTFPVLWDLVNCDKQIRLGDKLTTRFLFPDDMRQYHITVTLSLYPMEVEIDCFSLVRRNCR